MNAIFYVKNGHLLNISSSDVDEEKIKDITIYQKGATSAMLDDTILQATRSGNYLYLGDAQIVEGTETEEDEEDDDTPTGGRPTGGGIGGGGGSSASVSAYAANAVKHMKRMGLIDGYNGQFRPLDNLTRVEAAKVINSLISIINN